MTLPVTLTIPSDPKYLCLVRDALRSFLESREAPEKCACKIVLCVDEACSNIIKYCYEGETDKPIEISFLYENNDFIVKIRDYGKKCDASKIKPRALDDVKCNGLGTHFIFEIMDSVEYCTNLDKGTLLTMSKKLDEERTKKK